jgi:hypothetical protein
MVATATDLLVMSQAELDDLFRQSSTGGIPDGDADGTAIVAAGTEIEGLGARLAHRLAWRGKVFDADKGTLVNKITAFNIHAIKAKVYRQASWFDGQQAIILDYSKTSLVARKVRDEIRAVGPGLYLGQVYWNRTRVCNFALAFNENAPSVPANTP